MCNCNQKRAAYSKSSANSRSENNTRSEASSREMSRVQLVQDTPITIQGEVTGRTYVFGVLNDVNWVDNRDLPGIENIKGLQIEM